MFFRGISNKTNFVDPLKQIDFVSSPFADDHLNKQSFVG